MTRPAMEKPSSSIRLFFKASLLTLKGQTKGPWLVHSCIHSNSAAILKSIQYRSTQIRWPILIFIGEM
jgi:hypothetical protein